MQIQLLSIFLTIIAIVILVNSPLVKAQSICFKFGIILLLLAIASIRIFHYDTQMGLNLDEAMGGYNAWSLAHYGLDSALHENPVYLYAWGTGMNVLYPLIAIPFVKLLGLNLIAYRLPMVLLSIFSAFVLLIGMLKYKLPNKLIILSLLTIFLSPWSMMANRWALESNLFPIIFCLAAAAYLFFLSQKKTDRLKRHISLFLFVFMIAISAYAYSNNWLMLPIFFCAIFLSLYLHKQITALEILGSFLVTLLIVWPLLLFVKINFLGGKTVHFFMLTIPKLSSSRSNSELVIGHGHLLQAIFNNIDQFVRLIVTGNDHLIWNSLPQIGIFYPIMFVFALIGLYVALLKRTQWDDFMLISLIACLPIILIVKINVNHLNALMLPILYLEARGLDSIVQNRLLKISFALMFSALFVVFTIFYFKIDQTDLSQGRTLTPEVLGQAVRFADQQKTDKIYAACFPKGGYVIPLFYTPVSPIIFNHEKAAESFKTESNYSSYGKWFFKTPHQLSKNSLLIMKKGQKMPFSLKNKREKTFGQYRVYY